MRHEDFARKFLRRALSASTSMADLARPASDLSEIADLTTSLCLTDALTH